MTAEERAFNYASTQKPTKLQVGEIAKHYNNGYQQAIKNFMEKAEDAISMIGCHYVGEDYSFDQIWEQFKNYMQDESN